MVVMRSIGSIDRWMNELVVVRDSSNGVLCICVMHPLYPTDSPWSPTWVPKAQSKWNTSAVWVHSVYTEKYMVSSSGSKGQRRSLAPGAPSKGSRLPLPVAGDGREENQLRERGYWNVLWTLG